MSLLDGAWLDLYRRDRDAFARSLMTEMSALAAKMQACAALAELYLGERAQKSTSPGSATPAEAEALPKSANAAEVGQPRPDRTGVLVGGEPSAEAGEAGQPAPIPARPDTQSGATASSPARTGCNSEEAVVDPAASSLEIIEEALPACGDGPVAVESFLEPIPQPAIRTAIQNEGAVDQGEDQRAQKLEPLPGSSEAGAAEAERRDADPRNSSLAPAEAISRQAKATAGARTSPPSRTTCKETVLDLWERGERDHKELAWKAGCAPASVQVYLSVARREGDPRVATPTVAGYAKPVERKVESTAAAPVRKPEKLIGVIIDVPPGVVGFDTEQNIVVGPLGDWKTTAPVIRTLRKMNDGGLYDRRTLVDEGPWSSGDDLDQQIRKWTAELAVIGVEFVDVKKAGCRIRRAGE